MFKKKEKEKLKIFVSLSYKSLSVAYEEESELKIESINFDIQTDINTLIKVWGKSIKKLLSKVSFEPYLILLFNSSSFLVKNIPNIDNKNVIYDYLSKDLELPKGYFEITHIRDSSYLVVENSTIEKIMFTFKDYNISSLHDLSIINGSYLLIKDSELYINVSIHSIEIIHNGSVFQKRATDRFFLEYLQKSAKKLNLDLDSTYTYIRKNFSKISSYEELLKSTQNGAVELRGFVDTLTYYIQETLRYFSNYSSIEDIRVVYLDGDILELDFLPNIIGDKLGLEEIVPINQFLNLNDYKKVAPTISYRADQTLLDKSSILLDGLRYSDGKQEYIFVDNTLVAQKKLSKEQKKKIIGFKRVIDENEEKNSRSNREYKKPDKSIWKMNATELFELLQNKLSGNNSNIENKNDNENETENDERGKIILLSILVIGGAIYYFGMYIMDLELSFDRTIGTYESNIHSVDRAREKISTDNKVYKIESGINKILWTEKFITIAKNMPDEIWFSSIRLESVGKEIEGKKVKTTRVVLEGRCLPSSIGHISTIAEYMEKLINSDDNFRKDFINVSFGGAESIYDDLNRNLISFKLYCNFRKNINIKEIKKEVKAEKKSIVENIKSIKENSQKKKEMLNKLEKGRL